MKLYGIGIDVVSKVRFVKNADKIANKILTTKEKKIYKSIKHKIDWLSKRWAAKEAVSKAVGTGITPFLYWTDIEILNYKNGKPKVKIKKNLGKKLIFFYLLATRKIYQLHLL